MKQVREVLRELVAKTLKHPVHPIDLIHQLLTPTCQHDNPPTCQSLTYDTAAIIYSIRSLRIFVYGNDMPDERIITP